MYEKRQEQQQKQSKNKKKNKNKRKSKSTINELQNRNRIRCTFEKCWIERDGFAQTNRIFVKQWTVNNKPTDIGHRTWKHGNMDNKHIYVEYVSCTRKLMWTWESGYRATNTEYTLNKYRTGIRTRIKYNEAHEHSPLWIYTATERGGGGNIDNWYWKKEEENPNFQVKSKWRRKNAGKKVKFRNNNNNYHSRRKRRRRRWRKRSKNVEEKKRKETASKLCITRHKMRYHWAQNIFDKFVYFVFFCISCHESFFLSIPWAMSPIKSRMFQFWLILC